MTNKGIDKLKRIGGRLHRLTPLLDEEGDIIQYHAAPLRVEFTSRDLLQIMAGASLLSIPVAFTEEAWRLGGTLPTRNVVALWLFSLLIISGFIYFNSYRHHIAEYWDQYVKRIAVTYALAFLIVATILTLIEQCPWGVDNALAIKRVVIVSFPASISASISDMLE